MITEDVPPPTEQDAIQSMKDEGTFDDLRRACLECLEKNPSYISLRSDSDADVDLFLSKQKWKNSAEYKEQARREERDYHAFFFITNIKVFVMSKLLVHHFVPQLFSEANWLVSCKFISFV